MKKVLYKTNQNHPAIKAYAEAVEKGQTSHHVIYWDGGWVVKRADSSKSSQLFDTQKEAADYAKGIAQNMGTALFVHGADGRIVERYNL
ncbi:MAG: hypothetical protein G01um101416_361 [Microgenomates group bacterium Gr01-1014_16]|nr:MAG: hypothetical protein G01um101416_361 [Microgenomates group bacterium Gr01-1014_16]